MKYWMKLQRFAEELDGSPTGDPNAVASAPETAPPAPTEVSPAADPDETALIEKFNDIFGVDPASSLNEFGEPENAQEQQELEGQDPQPDNQQQTPPDNQQQQQEPPTGEKPAQTPEENARFAEERRQRQAAERQQQLEQEANRIAEERLAASWEADVARRLERIYGVPIDQIAAQLEQAELQKQAQEQNVPVEVIQQQHQTQQQVQQLREQLNQAEFNNWFRDKQAEKAQLAPKYPYLTDADLNGAISAVLTQFGNKDLPLEQAVMALYGDKILENIKSSERQNALAEVSGREPSGLPPQGIRTSTEGATVLTPEQKAMAKKLGISEKDYIANME